ncbi:MAG: PolC-type DNA polymerase III [Tissierellia bacterium]|nr:PolC-type DNA polymerase III [Tissierellia bacterium]
METVNRAELQRKRERLRELGVEVEQVVYAPQRGEVEVHYRCDSCCDQMFLEEMAPLVPSLKMICHYSPREQAPQLPQKEDLLGYLKEHEPVLYSHLEEVKLEEGAVELYFEAVCGELLQNPREFEEAMHLAHPALTRVTMRAREVEAPLDPSKGWEKLEEEEQSFVPELPPQEKTVEEKEDYRYGKDKYGEVRPLVEVSNEKNITVQVEIFSRDHRSTKKVEIVTLNGYDGTGSVRMKVFLKEKELGPFLDHFKKGSTVMAYGSYDYDNYERMRVLKIRGMKEVSVKLPPDNAPVKRVETHIHTKMSDMDGLNTITEFAKRAKAWGHEAIGLTDTDGVQAFPEAMEVAEKVGIKILYGSELRMVEDAEPIVKNLPQGMNPQRFVVFDLETTGFSPRHNEIIEIGAVAIDHGRITERFSSFVRPSVPIPPKITELTGISDEMVKNAPEIEEVLEKFEAFCEGSVLVAHNADFDCRFIESLRGEKTPYPSLDTLALARRLLPELKSYKLGRLAKRFGISLVDAHRAVNDAEATAELFLQLLRKTGELGIRSLDEMNGLPMEAPEKQFANPVTVFAQNLQGLKDLYEIISEAHMKRFYNQAKVIRSHLAARRDHLLIGTGGVRSVIIDDYLRGAKKASVVEKMKFFDYLEIAPPERYSFYEADGLLLGKADAQKMIEELIAWAREIELPVLASGDVRYLEEEDASLYEILRYKEGRNSYEPGAHYYSTEKMLEAFSFLGEELAREIVVEAPRAMADQLEEIRPIPKGKFPPKIPNADEELREDTYRGARAIYGENLPEIIVERLEKELNSIIGNGYAVMYRIAQQLVKKSNDDGYYVGSRGSVGSSLVATMVGITEVNPLAAHYHCGHCHYFELADSSKYSSGVDLPDKLCPQCGTPLLKDGHQIPFEVFLGFKGDKEPDIDLNFAGEYQPTAHQFVEDTFGAGYVFRAGTIGTLAERTAYGLVKKYQEGTGKYSDPVELERQVLGIVGVKRTTGQHPGGIMIVPKDEDIHHFTPIQYPADDPKKGVITTHFDYHSISENILKLDILGHDAPTILRMLEDMTRTNMLEVPLDDPQVMSLFRSSQALNILRDDYDEPVGTLGIPEFGTNFVVRMLLDTLPSTFAELVNISGLSHGTDVWTGNAQELVHQGKADLSQVISTREDIMNYLILAGAENKMAFDVMEAVRKGRGIPEKYEEELKKLELPPWYLDSCRKIKYMFPKAHAVAYVTTSVRIAWYKVNHPLAYYAAFFTTKLQDLNGEILLTGYEGISKYMEKLKGSEESTDKTARELGVLQSVREMLARGYEFEPVSLKYGHYNRFTIHDGKLVPPLQSLPAVGEGIAKRIHREYQKEPFLSEEDLVRRTGASASVVNTLRENRVLTQIPKTDQISLMDLF